MTSPLPSGFHKPLSFTTFLTLGLAWCIERIGAPAAVAGALVAIIVFTPEIHCRDQGKPCERVATRHQPLPGLTFLGQRISPLLELMHVTPFSVFLLVLLSA